MDIAGGITSGVSGIFTAPVRGAKKGGVGGFFTGVGKGLVGAVVKPVVGVTDSVISVAQVCYFPFLFHYNSTHQRGRNKTRTFVLSAVVYFSLWLLLLGLACVAIAAVGLVF